jgi:large subunit ribosomal protein L21
MYAVVKTGGKQYKVATGDKIRIEKLAAEIGSSIALSDVLMLADGANVRVGKPLLAGASVEAKVLSHGRADKVHIFKHRRRKHYKKSQGHRQYYTEVAIETIKG